MRYLWLVVIIVLVIIDRWLRRSTDKMIDDFVEEMHAERKKKEESE